jgi:Tol biopolymer transport system component
MATLSGGRLGPYEILSAIGAGGMGEVYKARDSRLNRDVALKVLPAAFAADTERMARFEREARLLASLNHPHIAALYGLEESGGTPALIMELVDGPTLADRIAAGPIPIDEALPIAREIAEALEYAHERGIIHRDLKPANIKVKPDGTVKVLDFGLAKAVTEDSLTVDMNNSPTLSMGATVAGVILGTAAYMSPEQAKAKPADRRADIWAFGVVLYEMLTGKRLYQGETTAETLAAVIQQTPGLDKLPPSTPPAIRNLVARCLEKDPRQRLQHIGEARIAIEHSEAPAAEAGAPRANSRERVTWAALATIFLLTTVALAALLYFRRPPEDARAIRFSVSTPDGWVLAQRLGTTGGSPAPLAVSPNGRDVAFVATKSDGTSELWVRPLDALTAQMLAGTEGASSPFWSPDSRLLAFFANGKLKKVDVSGGPPIELCDAADDRGGTWGRDGVIVFAPSNATALLQVPAAGGSPKPATVLAPGERVHLRPTFLPDGRHFLYSTRGRTGTGPVYAGTLGSNERKFLVNADSTNVVYSEGHLLFLRDTSLMAQPFDAQHLSLTGDAFPIVEQVQTQSTLTVGLFSASENGVLLYQTGASSTDSQLVWYDRTGKDIAPLGDSAHYGDVELSPDGKRAAVSLFEGNQPPAIWIYDVARGLRTRFTFGPAAAVASIWSPDGSRIAFSATDKGHGDLHQKASNGSGVDEVVLEDDAYKFPFSWSPDGQFILYTSLGATTRRDLFIVPLAGDRKPIPFLNTGFSGAEGKFSPDGRWIAYVSNESGRDEVYVAPFRGPGGKWQVSTSGGVFPRWRRDGAEIFFLTLDNKLMAAERNGKVGSFEVGSVTPLFDTLAVQGLRYPYDVSADGQRFLINTGPEHVTDEPLAVVVNWIAGVKK